MQYLEREWVVQIFGLGKLLVSPNGMFSFHSLALQIHIFVNFSKNCVGLDGCFWMIYFVLYQLILFFF